MFIIMCLAIIFLVAIVISALSGNWIYDSANKLLDIFREEENVEDEEQKEKTNDDIKED